MGNCSGSSSSPLNRRKMINQQLEQQQREKLAESTQAKKLLLLGAGESGKSTLFKQMIALYGKGFDRKDKLEFVFIVHQNIIEGIKVLVAEMVQQGSDDLPTESIEIVQNIPSDSKITSETVQHITLIWKTPLCQSIWLNRGKLQVMDAVAYFLDHIERITVPDYLPSEEDILRTRVRTTGIVQTDFTIDSIKFQLFDVGGQRNERKRWIHCFEDVQALIFVAAISEYDQVLFEDDSVNRLHESLVLFGEMCNSRWFTDTSVILFLNKRDLLASKLEISPLSSYFPSFDGGVDYEKACAFITNLFLERNLNPSKTIYTHITCATDKHNIDHVFNSVKDIIIQKSLADGGLE